MQIRVSDECFQYKKGKRRASHMYLQRSITRVMPPGWTYAAGEKEHLCRSVTERAPARGHVQPSPGMAQLCRQDQPHNANSFWRWLLGKMGQIPPYPMQEVSFQRFYSTNLPTFKSGENSSAISTHVTQLLTLSFTLFFPRFFLLALSPSLNLFWRLGTEFIIYLQIWLASLHWGIFPVCGRLQETQRNPCTLLKYYF